MRFITKFVVFLFALYLGTQYLLDKTGNITGGVGAASTEHALRAANIR